MSELVQSISIINLLNQRDAIVDRVRRAQDLLAECAQVAEATGLTSCTQRFDMLIEGDYRFRSSELLSGEKGLQKIIKRIDAWAWDKLLHESGLRTFMHAAARQEWTKQITELTCPPLTAESITETFRLLHTNRGAMLEDGVVAVFKRLSWHYKTNLPQRFGKRLVISRLADALGNPIYNSTSNNLDDLVRVFCVLEGKPEPDHRQGMYAQIGDHRHERFLDHEYFTLKWFKNGNGHLTFKRLDLVDELNAIIARRYPGALPHDRNAA